MTLHKSLALLGVVSVQMAHTPSVKTNVKPVVLSAIMILKSKSVSDVGQIALFAMMTLEFALIVTHLTP